MAEVALAVIREWLYVASPDKAELAQVKPERGFQAIGFVAVRNARIIVGRGIVDPREGIVVVDQLRPEAGDFKAVAAVTNRAASLDAHFLLGDEVDCGYLPLGVERAIGIELLPSVRRSTLKRPALLTRPKMLVELVTA
jgi:hypothetical protein